jgi:hypothetical protein
MSTDDVRSVYQNAAGPQSAHEESDIPREQVLTRSTLTFEHWQSTAVGCAKYSDGEYYTV